ncbi:hypothetical protein [Actinokineospora sp. UTMC 2448]|uniref:hypothetical protein n=1 Tax=Actinokineospora sp. UTMC 2448 TaxID=2268449 RepID=UPI002164785F|nr:hypothetical protein [Actinokineospora sp. UTMC 2448]
MGGLEETLNQLRSVLARTEGLQQRILTAITSLDTAQTQIAAATVGSSNPYAPATLQALQAGKETAAEAFTAVGGAGEVLGAYITHIGAPTTGTTPPATATTPRAGTTGAPAGTAPGGLSPREYALGYDPATQKHRPTETQTARRIEHATGVRLTRSPHPKGPDWIDHTGKTYDAVGNFPAKFFDRQWEQVKIRILDHLDKADCVPVDVSQFTPEQRAQVRAFIAPLGPRVFTVGE